jgi:hypothetical protein
MLEGVVNRLDSEQEREQEKEQEKEGKRKKEIILESEIFVVREYSRMEEVPKLWSFDALNSRSIDDANDHPFYPLKNFKLRHQEPLQFPDSLYLSSNFFNPNWVGLRRLKNVVMVSLSSISAFDHDRKF